MRYNKLEQANVCFRNFLFSLFFSWFGKNYFLLLWNIGSLTRACLPVKHLALTDTGYRAERSVGLVTQQKRFSVCHRVLGWKILPYTLHIHSPPSCIFNHFRDHEVLHSDSFRCWNTLPTARLLNTATKTLFQTGGVFSLLTHQSWVQGGAVALVTSVEAFHLQWHTQILSSLKNRKMLAKIWEISCREGI